ncbi:hypothetical protein GJ744_005578 [Endocarpon pusillum]|uniref:Uncharacterized protein n=1 Tax=Endocarpon pusillum TaxID=364733 RepID=A0A8H7E6E6_9EURO|nr:hypothetical protein GJ744_005578 [Endocarpon pusillum]
MAVPEELSNPPGGFRSWGDFCVAHLSSFGERVKNVRKCGAGLNEKAEEEEEDLVISYY